MALTLLLDLDDTLLVNPINTFLPGYLKLLGKHLMTFVAPDQMVQQLLTATQKMVENNTAERSLEQSFDEAFYPSIGKTKEELRSALEQFYDEVFPELQTLTQPRVEAQKMIQQASAQGHTLVVATNPLFPMKAILHRINWSGMGDVHFSLITAYERFHFAKPNPAYFAEILAQAGWPDQPAVMIGNSLEDDLMPAAKLGIPGFWVTDQTDSLPAGLPVMSAKGSMEDAAKWIQEVDAAKIKNEIIHPEGMLAVLKSTPAALETLTRDLDEYQWSERPEPEEWSLTEILCHLRDVDQEINIHRIEQMVTVENPFLPGIDSDSWAKERDYCKQSGPEALRAFIEARMRLVRQIEELPQAAWRLSARHAIFGPTQLKELISFIVTHDQTHVRQFIEVIQKTGGKG